MGAQGHRKSAEEQAVRCFVLVVSDTKTVETDTSGPAAVALLMKHGHEAIDRVLVPNQPRKIAQAARRALKESEFLLTIGGTGASARDVTVQTVHPMLDRVLPGFGELFRAKSAAQIGTAVILSRAMLGITKSGCVIACVPGSEDAVRLALEEILLPELRHLVWDARRHR